MPAAEILRQGTTLRAVPLVPGISLHLAEEPVSLWENVEAATGRTDTDPPFWAFAWAGGQALARYLLDHPEVVRGRRVMDIASGSGLVAIAAAQSGAAAVTAYDIDPLAITAIAVNAAANGVPVRPVCADVLDEAADTDLILVADAFYERRFAERVTRFLFASGIPFLVGDLGRTYLPRDRLAPVACYDVTGLGSLEDRDTKRTTIWTAALYPVCHFCPLADCAFAFYAEGWTRELTMAKIAGRRMAAEIDGDFVVFLIGGRLNFRHPVGTILDLGGRHGMKHMLDYLVAHPEKGLLGYQLGLPVIVQYWRSFDHLEAFARDTDDPHLAVWRSYWKRLGSRTGTGIWHETYLVRAGEYEAIYANMPPFGLGKAADLVPLQDSSSSRSRIRSLSRAAE